MNRIEAPQPDRTGELVEITLDSLFGELTPQQKKTLWAYQVLDEYNGLPKQTSREKRAVSNLVTQTVARLLQNPQDIGIAERIWRENEIGDGDTQEAETPLSSRVKKERLALIKEKWYDITPHQLAQWVRLYAANNDPSQNATEEMLKNYFRAPNSPNGRIDTYCNFVSGVLDLVGEDEAFKEGMKIAIHGTDILPRNPSLIEQEVLISLPYKEERAFKKLVVATHVTNQIVFMSAQDFTKYLQENKSFMLTDENAKKEWDRKQKMVVKQIGRERVKELNDAMIGFSQILEEGYLTEERKQILRDKWPYNIAFDENDPLNQKLKRVLTENRYSSTD